PPAAMGAKNRKQAAGKTPATDRERSPLVPPHGKSNVRRPGRESKAFHGLPTELAFHLSRLFENDRHFSHLSNLEKEMAFRTEMGLYYSYYKTIIEAPTFLEGLHMIMNDRLTEHPLVINTLKRFNLYPEVVLASWYRMYTSTMGYFGIPTKMCWSINRGEGLSPVDSCEGLGDPAYFYVTCVFLLNGVMMSLFFIYGAYLSGSRLGGIVTTLLFFFNHGESTRVMWTPPLRESFAYPFLVLQMLLLTYILRTRSPSRTALVALGISNLCFMLPWQFAQFVLLTQVKECDMKDITLGVCFLLMFGNSMLLTSFYASSLISIWVKKAAALFAHALFAFMCIGCAHISGLIKSKFTSYKDFHTMMYTCAAEFDFIELETPVRYLKTLLLPVNFQPFNVKTLFLQLVYHSLQLLAFALLAVLIMRLKLFLTPHMCIMGSLLCSRQLFGWIGERLKHQSVVLAVIAMMAVQGVANLQAQWAIIGEFSNLPQEELLDWIQENTRPDSVFAGAMPTMASVKLSTGRPIVNHPHYEDAGLRERTKLVYSMYSRMSGETVKKNLMKLGVDYFILEDSWCTRRTRPGCSMPEIWDIEDPQNVGKIPLCTHMSRSSRPYFTTVFSNDIYKVLKVPKDHR
uniref:Dpy-19-like 1, like (H. sapiens) n=1 Tax=Oryzias sinensis TaxID=183150 RepID=A0A8C7XNP7_9TELE